MVKGTTPFRKKLQSSGNARRALRVEVARQRLEPTLQDLQTREAVDRYCSKHLKTDLVRRRMLDRLERGTVWDQGDALQRRGWRNVAPRSFVEPPQPTTPPGFWLLDDIPSPKEPSPQKKRESAPPLTSECAE
jgi:hypothetical protein